MRDLKLLNLKSADLRKRKKIKTNRMKLKIKQKKLLMNSPLKRRRRKERRILSTSTLLSSKRPENLNLRWRSTGMVTGGSKGLTLMLPLRQLSLLFLRSHCNLLMRKLTRSNSKTLKLRSVTFQRIQRITKPSSMTCYPKNTCLKKLVSLELPIPKKLELN